MNSKLKRDWGSKEWEDFARDLVKVRHGAQNVQSVPDKVRGDAGIEFFTMDGCCYQCYAPDQSTDTAKAASAMRSKATRDLKKLKKNASAIASLLVGGCQITRWILCCPFLDDKSVISHVRAKAEELAIPALPFVGDGFQALVHSLTDFGSEVSTLRAQNTGIPVVPQVPSSEQTSFHFTKFGTQIDVKLERGFPQMSADLRAQRAHEYIRAHLSCVNMLDELQQESPALWETYRRVVRAEEQRLQTVGSGPGAASGQLTRELERLEAQFHDMLPSLDRVTVTHLSTGTLATWLIECPLDFERSLGQ